MDLQFIISKNKIFLNWLVLFSIIKLTIKNQITKPMYMLLYLEGGGTLATSLTIAAVRVLVAHVIAWAMAVPPIPIIAAWKSQYIIQN